MENFDWSRFEVRIDIQSTLEKLYNAWATRKGIEEWFLRTSEYREAGGRLRADEELVSAGDSYKWLWHGWPDETVENGEITRVNGKDQFCFSFGKAGHCTVNILQEENDFVVELIQEEIPVDDEGKHSWHVGCKTGWTFYFANMKSILEGGIDLRNKDASRTGLINK